MNQLTEKQYDSLVKWIYATLINGEEMGLGEMGDCEDEAKRIIDGWMEENKIELLEDIKPADLNRGVSIGCDLNDDF